MIKGQFSLNMLGNMMVLSLETCNGLSILLKDHAISPLINGFHVDSVKLDLSGVKFGVYKRQGSLPKPTKVIFNPPATVVYWSDNDKTVVKCREGDEFSEEIGFAMAFMKKVYGSRGCFKKALNDVAVRQYPPLFEDFPDYEAFIEDFGKRIMEEINKGIDDELSKKGEQ